jgi:hypothetical protein
MVESLGWWSHVEQTRDIGMPAEGGCLRKTGGETLFEGQLPQLDVAASSPISRFIVNNLQDLSDALCNGLTAQFAA